MKGIFISTMKRFPMLTLELFALISLFFYIVVVGYLYDTSVLFSSIFMIVIVGFVIMLGLFDIAIELNQSMSAKRK